MMNGISATHEKSRQRALFDLEFLGRPCKEHIGHYDSHKVSEKGLLEYGHVSGEVNEQCHACERK